MCIWRIGKLYFRVYKYTKIQVDYYNFLAMIRILSLFFLFFQVLSYPSNYSEQVSQNINSDSTPPYVQAKWHATIFVKLKQNAPPLSSHELS